MLKKMKNLLQLIIKMMKSIGWFLIKRISIILFLYSNIYFKKTEIKFAFQLLMLQIMSKSIPLIKYLSVLE